MRFGLLGPLEVTDDAGTSVELGGAQARRVLAMLLLAGGRVVTADAIVDAIWGDDPPTSATGTLQSYVSRLRRVVEPGRAQGAQPQRLRWEPPGYRLVVEPEQVDSLRFVALADAGRARLVAGDPAEARRLLLDAEAQWRGPALVEYRDEDFAAGAVARLEERRLLAVEDRIAAALELGDHAGVVGELGQLVGDHPLRETLRAHLAVALYRAGRQADALRAIDHGRRILRDELGIEPGRGLRDLEAAILAHDPELDGRVMTGAAASAVTPSPEPAVGPPAAGAGGWPSGLVGRDRELRQALDVLAEAWAGTRVVILEGEPGIGKTRLAEEVSAEAARRGAMTLWGRAYEGGAAPSFWPWIAPLQELVAAGAEPPPPELRAVLTPGASGSEAWSGAEHGRFSVFEAVTDLLSKRAAERPVVLVLDDLQWADPASLQLLSALGSRLVSVPLLFVLTVRELEIGRNDAVVEALAQLTRRPGTRRIHLLGLRRSCTAALVQAETGEAPDPELAAAVHARAEGNPFFTTELARLVQSGAVTADVPSGVRDVVRRRLSLLPELTNHLLEVAAVIGRDVDVGLLTRVSGHELDECLDALDAAIVHRLLVPVPERPGCHRFTHALVREVLVDGMSPLRRARVHLDVADSLGDGDDEAEIQAEHLWQAVAIGAAPRAAAALERAADVAIARTAYATAEDQLQRAVELRRSLASTPGGSDAELEALARLISVVGAHRGYVAVTQFPLLARAKRLAAETRRTVEHANLLWSEWAGHDLARNTALADPLAQELLALAERENNELALMAGHLAYGIGCWHRGRMLEAAAHIDKAHDLAAVIPRETAASVLFDLDQVRLAAPFAIFVHDLIGDAVDPEASYEELVRRVNEPYYGLLVWNFAASGAMAVGDFARAERAGRRGLEVDPDAMSAFWSDAQRALLGAAITSQGRLAEGLALLDGAVERYTAQGPRTNVPSFHAYRAAALAEAGRVEEAERSLADARTAVHRDEELFAEPTVLLADAAISVAQGDEAGATRALDSALTVALGQGAQAVAAHVRRAAAGYGIELGGR